MIWQSIAAMALVVLGGLANSPSAERHPQITGTDVDGQVVPLVKPDTRAIVLYFLASDCPISNRTIPEMKRVESEFSGRGFQFWFVYPNVTQTPESIHTHLASFGLGPMALTDPHGSLARMTGARWTPESAILLREQNGLRTVYVGRIDDRYLGIGKERPQATKHDLEDAIGAVLAGKQPNPPGGPSVGCGIVGAR